MKIKKFGHCCLLIEVDGVKLLTDPGSYTTEQQISEKIDAVLITHEHADHLHVESLKEVLKKNPEAVVITNTGVGKKLDEAGVAYTVVEGRSKTEVKGIEIEAYDGKHEEIFEEIGQVQNTGYFIAGKLFYPGDSFKDPEREVDVLALPVAGPWCKIPDAVRYALQVKPKKAFPVHDGMIKPDSLGLTQRIPEKVLTDNGIEFIILNAGEEKEF
jgi:L-ascorbate metabolism protein UlaG (beta-lactamase superfamily)